MTSFIIRGAACAAAVAAALFAPHAHAQIHPPGAALPTLKDVPGVLPWSQLEKVDSYKAKDGRLLPKYPDKVLALDKQPVQMQGFMMPLEPGEKHTHFLLSSVPLSCSFCTPGGPESMVEVKTKTPVRYTLDPVVVEGRFALLNDDPYGLYDRITDAVSVK